jgi:hypothetical protein
VKQELPVILSEELLREKSVELGRVTIALEDEERAWKAASTAHRERVASLREAARTLSHAVATGSEMRLVDVEEKRYRDRSVVEVVRLDTGEVFVSRPMTPAERQGELFAVEGK